MRSRKTILSLVLTLALLAAMAVPASAVTTISLNQEMRVTVPDNESAVMFQFTPAQTGNYSFYSFHKTEGDPCGYITDKNGDMLASSDDVSEEDNNFNVSCYLTAGEVYYLCATSYANAAAYSVQILKQVSPTSLKFSPSELSGPLGSTCYPEILFSPAGCAVETVTMTSSDPTVAYVDAYGAVYFTGPGTATITAQTSSGLKATATVTTLEPPTIEVDQPYILDAAEGDQYLTFTARTPGWYGIFSEGDEIDACVSVYDTDFREVAFDDDSMGGYNFFASFFLDAGQTRYLQLQPYDRTGVSTVTLQKLNRAASISFKESEITAYLGGFCALEPVYAPVLSIPENLTWTSNNSSVAKVDAFGYVDFLAKGTATIRFTSETGKTDSVKITVIGSPTDSDLIAWGICGPQLQWKLNNAGVLTITGYGDMYDYYYTWQDHASQIKQVVFPAGITGIGENAFNGCSNLTELTIPQGVKRIGYGAFMDCASLEQVSLPASITDIGYSAFRRCAALTAVKLPDSLSTMGQYAFADCTALTQVSGGSYKRLPMRAFSDCTALTQVSLPANLQSIGDFAFYACPLSAISLPQSLMSIGFSAFEGCRLAQIDLPANLTTIHHYAFICCPITQITIPEKVSYMGDDLFQSSALTQITFLGSIPYICPETFSGIEATAYYPGSDPSWTENARQDYGGVITWTPYGMVSAAISGTVTSAGTKTVTLELWSEGSTSADYTVTATEGGYRFSNIPFGVYILTAYAEDHAPKSFELTVTENMVHDFKLCRYGDVTGDQKTNLGDVARLFVFTRNGTAAISDYVLACADVNHDGKINMGDVARTYAHVRGKNPMY